MAKLSEQQRADLAKKRGQQANQITDTKKRQAYIAEQGNREADARRKGGDDALDKSDSEMATHDYDQDNRIAATGSPDRSYKKGTDRVPSTGPANLHKDEAVLAKPEAEKYRTAKTEQGGQSPFSTRQIAEDTERQMMGKPQRFGAAPKDDEDGLLPDQAQGQDEGGNTPEGTDGTQGEHVQITRAEYDHLCSRIDELEAQLKGGEKKGAPEQGAGDRGGMPNPQQAMDEYDEDGYRV